MDDLKTLEPLVLGDRAAVLASHVPGTASWYPIACLALEQGWAVDPEALKRAVEAYEDDHPSSVTRRFVRRRTVLGGGESKEAVDELRSALSVNLSHTRVLPRHEVAPNAIPSSLPPATIATDALLQATLRSRSPLSSLNRATNAHLHPTVLSAVQDNPRLIHDYFQAFGAPDVDDPTVVPAMVAAAVVDWHLAPSVRAVSSSPYFMFPLLSLEQLLQLGADSRVGSRLAESKEYVSAVLKAMTPAAGHVNPTAPLADSAEYLTAVAAYVSSLPPQFNYLRFLVAHHQLQAVLRSTGSLADHLEAVVAYATLPRSNYPTLHALRTAVEDKNLLVRHGSFPVSVPGLPSSVSQPEDVALLKTALAQLFAAGTADPAAFTSVLDSDLVTRVAAEAKLLAGDPDTDSLLSVLGGSSAVQTLKDQVRITLCPHNPTIVSPADPVTLHADVKNVPSLLVKVFEVNTTAVYTETKTEVSTAMNLDGMIPTEEFSVEFDSPPVQQVRRDIPIPSLSSTRRGVFIVELIGNGVSSRAVVRKGRLHLLSRSTVAGHAVTVLDEANAVVPDASVWMGGQYFKAEDPSSSSAGTILIPYATGGSGAGRMPVVLTSPCPDDSWTFSSLAVLHHQVESYTLSSGFYVNRETLVRDNRKAVVAIRPQLLLHGHIPAPLAALENVTLTLTSTDEEGTASSKVFRNFALATNSESTVEFPVPYGLRGLDFVLEGDVKILATGATSHVSASHHEAVNSIDGTDCTFDLFLAHTVRDGYVVHVLGKTGEPIADQSVAFEFQHSLVDTCPSTVLKTTDDGRVVLGPLHDIVAVTASITGVPARHWDVRPATSWSPMPPSVHTLTAEAVQVSVPYVPCHPEAGLTRLDASLRRDHANRQDCFGALALTDDGYVTVSGLPEGQYTLTLRHPTTSSVAITVVEAPSLVDGTGATIPGFLCGRASRYGCVSLETPLAHPQPITVSSVSLSPASNALSATVVGGAPGRRVHFAVTRFVPDVDPATAFHLTAAFGGGGVTETRPQPSQYLSGRTLSDEHRYILDRRALGGAAAGNSLSRPGLLLNPWAIGATETDIQEAARGTDYDDLMFSDNQLERAHASMAAGAGGGGGTRRSRARGRNGRSQQQSLAPADKGYANMDFLGAPGVLLTNIPVDSETGRVSVDLAAVGLNGGDVLVTVVACDDFSSAVRRVPVDASAVGDGAHRRLELKAALDTSAHFVQQRQVTSLLPGASVDVTIASDSKAEEYDTLSKLYSLFCTVSGNSSLSSDFAFLVNWPTLSDADKQAKYSTYACHELNLFLSLKDRPFFDAVVAPFLACKRAKTFMDDYLLGADLAPYLSMDVFHTLNAAEQALLCGRSSTRLAETLGQATDAAPTSSDRFDALFRQAIASSSLDSDKDDLMQMLTQETTAKRPQSMAMPRSLSHRAERLEDLLDMSSDEDEDDEDYDDEGGCCDEAEEECKEDFGAMDMSLRKTAGKRTLYQAMDKTQEFAEQNYYKIHPSQRTSSGLIALNEFWADLAAHRSSGSSSSSSSQPFVSKHALLATRNLNEMLMALAVTDLPFSVPTPHAIGAVDGKLRFEATASPLLVFHKDLASVPAPDQTTVLVGQNYFDPQDRYHTVRGVRMDKYVTSGEFLRQKVYGCQVVVTNVSCAQQSLDLLLQIPAGALPVSNGFVMRSRHMNLSAYSTQQVDYYFYFPDLGDFPHYPVHVAREETLVAFVAPTTVRVVLRPTVVDNLSWEYVSQQAPDDDVVAYLETQPLANIQLSKVCWRLKDAGMYGRVMAVLRARMAYDGNVWSYGFLHNDVTAIREYVGRNPSRVAEFAGPACSGPLVSLAGEPFVGGAGGGSLVGLAPGTAPIRSSYDHREFDPLVNARAHQLGATRKILNRTAHKQYMKLLEVLAHKAPADVTSSDWLAVTYHLLLQDRVQDARDVFARVKVGGGGGGMWESLQHTYMKVYMDFFSEDGPKESAALAAPLVSYPVPKWANKFKEAMAQLKEAGLLGADGVEESKTEDGAGAGADDADLTREQRQAKAAAAEPALELAVEGGVVVLTHSNLSSPTSLRFYKMDIELLFTHSPFVSNSGGGSGGGSVGEFAYIRPNLVLPVSCGAGADETTTVPLPDEFKSANVMVEAVSGGLRAAQAHYATSMRVAVLANYGQLKVTASDTKAPLARVYVKVFSRRHPGDQGKFYKDGYTDIRGRFDYTSLNTDELSHVERFSMLVMGSGGKGEGSVVVDARPPKQ